MLRIGTVSTIAVLAAMLVSVNGRSPTRSFSLGATTLAGVVLPEESADKGRGMNARIQ
jgi:hypothetical protein